MKIEPVAKVTGYSMGREVFILPNDDLGIDLPIGTPLYAIPPDHVIVPREPTEAMVYVMSRILDTNCWAYAKQMCENVIEAAGVDDE